MDIAEYRRDRRIFGRPDRYDRVGPVVEAGSVAPTRHSFRAVILAVAIPPRRHCEARQAPRQSRRRDCFPPERPTRAGRPGVAMTPWLTLPAFRPCVGRR